MSVNGIVSGSGVSTIHKITADGLTVNGIVSGSGVSTIHKVTSDGLTVNGIVSGSGVSTIHQVTADKISAAVVTGSGTHTIYNVEVDRFTAGTVDINGGAIDGAAIGAASPSSIKATTISGSGIMNVVGNAFFEGTLNVTGAAEFDGNVTLGDHHSDVTTVTGRLTASSGIAISQEAYINDHAIVADDKKMYFGADKDSYIQYGPANSDYMTISGSATGLMISGSHVHVEGMLTHKRQVIVATGGTTTLTGQDSGAYILMNNHASAATTVRLPDSGGGFQYGAWYTIANAMSGTAVAAKIVCTDTSNEVISGMIRVINMNNPAAPVTSVTSSLVPVTAANTVSAITFNGGTSGWQGSKVTLISTGPDTWSIIDGELASYPGAGAATSPFSDS